ncbi:MAG: hypothetical protein C0599_04950, partial [Salinivirgaceae bacterium]
MKPIYNIIFLALFTTLSINLLAQKNYETHFIETPPTIDGLFNEDVWNKGKWINEFTQRSPLEGAKPSQKTI